MNPALCSVHTHSILCDGNNTLSEMAAAAYAAGVRYFGASGHSHTPAPMDQDNVLPADLTEYRTEVARLRAEYAGRMDMLLGLEWDSRSDASPPPDLDYWIGSVHDLYDPDTGKYYPIDWKAEYLAACCVEMFHGDFPALIRQYYADVATAAAKKPTILGHLDQIVKLNGDGSLFDESDRHYRDAALFALHSADPQATLLEVNTGGVFRGYRKAPYPALFLLKEWRKMGGRILLTADSHSVDSIVFGYDMAAEVARAAGFAECTLLTGQGPVSCPL